MYTVIAVRFILSDRMELAIKRERKLYFLHTWKWWPTFESTACGGYHGISRNTQASSEPQIKGLELGSSHLGSDSPGTQYVAGRRHSKLTASVGKH